MSRLVKEDDDYIYLVEYVHHDPDSYSDWMCTPDLKVCPDPKWPDELLIAADTALYEIRVEYRVNKKTYEVIYDEIKP